LAGFAHFSLENDFKVFFGKPLEMEFVPDPYADFLLPQKNSSLASTSHSMIFDFAIGQCIIDAAELSLE
jgi:hypothetical protein